MKLELGIGIASLVAVLSLGAGCSKASGATDGAPQKKAVSLDDYCKRTLTLAGEDEQGEKLSKEEKKELAAMTAKMARECVTSTKKAADADPDGFQSCATCANDAKTWKAFLDDCSVKCDDFAPGDEDPK